jgi:hypothetical protein
MEIDVIGSASGTVVGPAAAPPPPEPEAESPVPEAQEDSGKRLDLYA